MMTPVNADDNAENMKTGQGGRGVWPGELPEEMTSEQRPEGIREGPMGVGMSQAEGIGCAKSLGWE